MRARRGRGKTQESGYFEYDLFLRGLSRIRGGFRRPTDGERDYALAPHVQEQIGRRLAAVYDEVLRQPIPERFLRLLDRLDQATAETAKDRSSTKETVTETLDQLSQTTRTTKQRSPAKETEID